jgi:hypothetical protein
VVPLVLWVLLHKFVIAVGLIALLLVASGAHAHTLP